MALQTHRGRIFSFNVPVGLAENGTYAIVPEEQDRTSRKFMPFNILNIFNDSDENYQVFVNDDNSAYFVQAKQQKAISGQDIRRATVQNISTTTSSANEVKLEFQAEDITGDTFAKVIAEKSPLAFLFKLPR